MMDDDVDDDVDDDGWWWMMMVICRDFDTILEFHFHTAAMCRGCGATWRLEACRCAPPDLHTWTTGLGTGFSCSQGSTGTLQHLKKDRNTQDITGYHRFMLKSWGDLRDWWMLQHRIEWYTESKPQWKILDLNKHEGQTYTLLRWQNGKQYTATITPCPSFIKLLNKQKN